MPATQDFLQFDHIRDDVLVLRNGDLRAILMVSSVNFGLKSQEEQDALTYAFQGFLNALDFDLQMLVHSRRLNVDPYLQDLRDRLARQENELLQTQTREYIEFIESFIAETNIMTKHFYLIVPFSSLKAKQQTSGMLKALPFFFSQRRTAVVLEDAQFRAAKTQLLQRVEFLAQNLAQLGLPATMLKTEEILELLWRLYNPERQEAGASPAVSAEALENM